MPNLIIRFDTCKARRLNRALCAKQKQKDQKQKNKTHTKKDQNRSNKQSSTLVNSRREGKKAEKPTFGNLLLCRAEKQPSPTDSNCQIYLSC